MASASRSRRSTVSPRVTRRRSRRIWAVSFFFPIFPLCAQGCDTERHSQPAQQQPSAPARGSGSDSGAATTSSAQPATETPGAASRTIPLPVRAERSGASAHVDVQSEKPWARSCRIHRPCAPARRIPRCSPDLSPIDAGTIGDLAPGPIGEVLAVRGVLALAFGATPGRACRYQQDDASVCCEVVSASALVVNGFAHPGEPTPQGVKLEALGCVGDESRLCCDVPVLGQRVIAAGKLARVGPSGPFGDQLVAHGRHTLRGG